MAGAFGRAGSLITNATTTTLALVGPSCSVGEVLVAFIYGNNVQVVTAPAGWASVHEVNNSTTMRASVYVKLAQTGDSGATFNFTKPVDDNLLFAGVIAAYTGVRGFNYLDATAAASSVNVSADNVTFPAFDPTSAACLVIAAAFYSNDLTTFGSITGTNPSLGSPNVDLETSAGNDCTIAVYSGTSDGAAITSGRTAASASTADGVNVGVLFALINDAPVTDTLVCGATDGPAALSLSCTALDSLLLGAIDLPTSSMLLSATENLLLGLQEPATESLTVGRGDSSLLGLTETAVAGETATSKAPTETVLLGLNDLASITVTLVCSDTLGLSITEVTSQTVTLDLLADALQLNALEPATESLTTRAGEIVLLGLTEIAVIDDGSSTTKAGTDTTSLNCVEAASISVLLSSLIDATTLATAESTATSVTMDRVETLAAGLADVGALSVTVSTSDSLALPLSEAATPTILIALQDVLLLGASDVSTALSIALMIADSLALPTPETMLSFAMLATTDLPAIGVVDGATPATSLAVADSLASSVSDTAVLLLPIAATDIASLSETDGAGLSISASSTDNIRYTCGTETATINQDVSIGAVDTIGLHANEATPSPALTVALSDSLGLRSTESAVGLSTSIIPTDILGVNAIEPATESLMTHRGESSAIGLADALAPPITLVAVTDTLRLRCLNSTEQATTLTTNTTTDATAACGAVESASESNVVAGLDLTGASIAELSSSSASLNAADSLASLLTDIGAATVLSIGTTPVLASDVIGLGATDVSGTLAVSLIMLDALTIGAVDASALALSSSLTDVVAATLVENAALLVTLAQIDLLPLPAPDLLAVNYAVVPTDALSVSVTDLFSGGPVLVTGTDKVSMILFQTFGERIATLSAQLAMLDGTVLNESDATPTILEALTQRLLSLSDVSGLIAQDATAFTTVFTLTVGDAVGLHYLDLGDSDEHQVHQVSDAIALAAEASIPVSVDAEPGGPSWDGGLPEEDAFAAVSPTRWRIGRSYYPDEQRTGKW